MSYAGFLRDVYELQLPRFAEQVAEQAVSRFPSGWWGKFRLTWILRRVESGTLNQIDVEITARQQSPYSTTITTVGLKFHHFTDDIVWPYLPDLLAWWRGDGPANMSREGGALRAAIGGPFTSGERARKRTSPFGSISFRN